MAAFVEEALTLAFLGANAVRLAAYAPQIAALLRSGASAAGVSVLSWALFGASNLATALYAAAVLGDGGMALLFAANLACCVAIVALALLRRRGPRRQMASRGNRTGACSAAAAASSGPGRDGVAPPLGHLGNAP